ncbi:ABC superfamily ATP binding cassette transporter substrate binding/membrane-spanning protein [Streptococcus gallolyticus subsp. gallolyticus ATCC BAA-2069]|uniref:ABC transporter substrate binding protein n=1 Tax=Streptococcus gallolyticus TaxID=315405 RepID=UPI000201BD35|nr:ABC transporter substrate binding protein [Streptococcus gallolyticus]CBZ47311.1 ABC superfamily ATP binding cassette transporter substrate binding/membrane-spanning protein [Streptococcus gallolyticus subsp. gallolyticus ATCC BAA-2069]
MKRNMAAIMALMLAVLTLFGCSSSKSTSDDVIHIGILQYVEHQSLTAARKGFVDELKKEGYVDGDNIVIDYENAQGDQSNLQTISTNLIANNDLVLGIATPAAQTLANLSTDVPVLFTAVTDPVSAKLVDSMENPGGIATGTSDMSPISKQVELLQKVMPNVKKVGIMYTTNERNSEVQVEEAKEAFAKAGIEVITKGISSTNDVQDTAKSLMSQTEVLFIPTDNMIVSAISLITELSKETKIPVVGGSADVVEQGVLFTYGANYEALGRQTAKLAIRILEGEDVSDVAAEYPETLNVVTNDEMAETLGIDLSSIENDTTESSSDTTETSTSASSSTSTQTSDSSSTNGWLDIVLSAISQGLLWSIMAIGVFITFRILDIADLSAEGSFPLGAASTAIMIVNGINPLIATIGGFLAGMIAGAVSGFMHTKMKIPALLTGIITLTALYSINLLVLGSANVSLAGQETLVTLMTSALNLSKLYAVILIGVIFVALVIILLVVLLNTQVGLALRATGDNIAMGEANGIKVDRMKILGYMISNGLIALAGSLLAQNNGYADMNMGTGTIVNGLASIILAEVIVKYLPLGKRLWSIVLGSILYRLVLVIILAMNVDAQMLKLASAILLALILYVPEIRNKLHIKPSKTLTPGGED